MPPKSINQKQEKIDWINSPNLFSALIVFWTSSILLFSFFARPEIAMAPFNLMESIVTRLIEVVVIDGVGGVLSTLKSTADTVANRLYTDFTIEKIVLICGVAVVVRQFPWVMDSIVKMLSKPPK